MLDYFGESTDSGMSLNVTLPVSCLFPRMRDDEGCCSGGKHVEPQFTSEVTSRALGGLCHLFQRDRE